MPAGQDGHRHAQHDLNRNRQTKRQPPATEPMLAVVRFDDEQGKPISVLVNFAAHPTMINAIVLKFSADYPAAMKKKVEGEFGTHCVFMQGAVGRHERQPPPEPQPTCQRFPITSTWGTPWPIRCWSWLAIDRDEKA